jgi:hypothetical protein
MVAENSSMALSPPNPEERGFSPSKPQQAPRRLLCSSRQSLESADGQHDAVNLEPDALLRWTFDLVFYFSELMVSEDLLSSPTSDATAGSKVLSARNH